MTGRAALILLALAGLLAAPVLADDAEDDPVGEVPLLPGEQATSPAPTAPPRPTRTPRGPACRPGVRLRRVPVYEAVEVPVFERRAVPRYREIQVPVFKNRCVPVYATRIVPVFENRSVLAVDPPCLPRIEVVRCFTGWREERVLRGERCERVRCGVRPHLVCDGVVEESVQTGTRTERRLVGWRCEPCFEDPAGEIRVGEGVLTPCAR